MSSWARNLQLFGASSSSEEEAQPLAVKSRKRSATGEAISAPPLAPHTGQRTIRSFFTPKPPSDAVVEGVAIPGTGVVAASISTVASAAASYGCEILLEADGVKLTVKPFRGRGD